MNKGEVLMRWQSSAVVLVVALFLTVTGCYHATVETGRPVSGQTIQNDWAHGFLFGLVPPSTVETAAQCPNGVARVSTQISFLNGLASAIVSGLYSPMTITVEYAAGGMAAVDGQQGTTARPSVEMAASLERAARRSMETGEAVYVAFD